jgi:DNA-directed RNA polymerase subunit H (RpoH/RPB5)
MYKIYEVLFKFCASRGYTTPKMMTHDEFAKEMRNKSVLIPVKNGDKDISIILLDNKHGAMSRQDDVKRLLRNPGEKIIISNSQPKSNIINVINKHSDPVFIYSRKAFLTDIRNNSNAPLHTIVDKSEIPKEFFNVHELPNIMLTDPQIIWLGGKVGDIIRVDGYDKNTGTTIGYRVVCE